MRYKFILLLAIVLPMFVLAKNGSYHCKDMLDVLGIPQNDPTLPSYRHASQVAKEITTKIDDYTSLFHRITSVAPGFNLGESRHRMLFHWGFNEDPKHCEALSERINAAANDEITRTRIWDLIKQEQGRRNRSMMAKAALEFKQNSGFPLIRDEQNALASIMYNVHILGDYEVSGSSQTIGMVTMNAIIADTIRSVRQRLRDPNMDIVREFDKKLTSTKVMPDRPNKASKILELMRIYIPRILHDNERMKKIVYGES